MKKILRTIKALLKKDFLNALSYKMQFFSSIVGTIITVSIFFFISQIFSLNDSDVLEKYNNDFFNFIFMGIIMSELSYLMITSLSNEINNYRVTGTFEEILSVETPDIILILSSYAYPITAFFFKFLIYLMLGYFIFNLNLIPDYGFLIFLLITLISLISLIGIGLIASSYALVFLKGNPFTALYSTAVTLLGGVVFPVEVLPEFLSFVSFIIPMTHSLELLRGPTDIILMSNEFFFHLKSLILLSSIYLVLGYLLTKKAFKIAKKNGSLLIY
tara:strand:+ start:440 stop:1258 length:819 start_codon:yes stop_codon:yes gene_type:complete